jgi:hypothetical protein
LTLEVYLGTFSTLGTIQSRDRFPDMTRPYANRRLKSRRSHIHIEKDDGNKKLKLVPRSRGQAEIANKSKSDPDRR